MAKNEKPNYAPRSTYITGFIISVILTLEAYFLVVREALPYWILIFTVFALAVIQTFVQLFFFLHLDSESKPRWKMTTFLFAGLVVIIVVFGSLWIMTNLHYNQEKSYSPEEIGKYIEEEEAIYR
ncbi:cytochrome o ubiquinol oxidase subunit IV [Candidatus Parcubacteria bacterium]|nr:cytochrome o ubiquinol oxidase subunit IV [Candidatus Parcubacteria bacterium]